MIGGSRRAVAVLVLLLLGLLVPFTPAVATAPGPVYAQTLKFTIATVNPTVVTAESTSLTVTGTVTNTGKLPVSGLSYIAQRGLPLVDPAAIQAALTTPTEPTTVITRDWRPFGPDGRTLAPGAAMAFTVTVPLTGEPASSLNLTEGGVYPVMFNVNGELGSEEDYLHARVGELHLTTTVLSPPAATGSRSPVGVSLLWPLVDRPHLGVGGVFLDEELAASISPNGRLATVLNTLEISDPPPGSITLVIDPMLLDELSRMAGGYRVLADPRKPQPALVPGQQPATVTSTAPSPTPTSGAPATGGPAPSADTVPGTGGAMAAAFLSRLQLAAAQYRVLLLPYSDPDVVAMVSGGVSARLRELVTLGRQVAARTLPGVQLITDIAYPVDGLVNSATVTALAQLDYRGVLLDRTTVAGGRTGTVTAAGLGRTVPGLVTDSALAPIVDAVLAAPSAAAASTALSRLAALLTGQSRSASGAPLMLTPDRHWNAEPAKLARLIGLLRELDKAGVVDGLSLPSAVTAGGPPVELNYPATAAAAQLTRDQVRRVESVRLDLQRLRPVLGEDPSVRLDPADLLDPLQQSLISGYSVANRSDDTQIRSVLSTVQGSLGELIGRVQIVSGGRYQLASASSPLRISVRNTLPYTVTLRLGVVRNPPAITVAPTEQTFAANRPQQVELRAEVRQQGGTFPMEIVLSYPGAAGTRWAAPTPVVVSSHAYGALTIILIAAAGGVLLLMVALRITQRIRGRAAAADGKEQ